MKETGDAALFGEKALTAAFKLPALTLKGFKFLAENSCVFFLSLLHMNLEIDEGERDLCPVCH